MLQKTLVIFIGVAMLGACSESSDVADATGTENQSSADNTAQTSVAPVQQTQPNVLFILLDDMGYGDVGFTGSEIATPNLDEIAADGVVLNRNYVYPICSPTRAALLTGHNPLDYGIEGPMPDHVGLPLNLKVMPEYFQDMGYQTFMLGKWHLGIGNTDFWPISRGFDYHYGFLGGWIDFYTHMYAGGLDWQRDGKSLREEGHATDLLTADALRVIESRNPDRPFFMYLAYNAPHSPLQTTPSDSGLNSHIEPGDRKIYAEMVTQTDRGIGQLMDTLEQQGILENTIVVFSSDNGGDLTQGASNVGLRAGKGQAYEGGMRVPGVVRWPGHVDGGTVLEQPIIAYDWLPTLLDAVGGDAADVENPYGQSMWAAIADGEQVERRATTIGIAISRAAFDWPMKLVRHTDRAPNSETVVSLFNVLEDPNEENNLAAEMPEKTAELLALLDVIPDVSFPPNPGTPLPRPQSFFWNASGEGWDYEVRVPETLPPWAEAAQRGAKWTD